MKDDIIFWDDTPFWLKKKDTIEKIIEDFIKLEEDYKKTKEMNKPLLHNAFTSLYQFNVDMFYMIQIMGLGKRLNRIMVKELEKNG